MKNKSIFNSIFVENNISFSKKIKKLVNEKWFLDNLLINIVMILKNVFQVIYFILLARTLGAEEYGLFNAVISINSIFIPFSMMGSGNILIKNTSINQNLFPKYWGYAQTTIVIFGIFFSLIVSGLFLFLNFNNFGYFYFLLLCLSDLLIVRFIDLSSQAFQAFNMTIEMMKIQILLVISKFISVIIFSNFFYTHTAISWSVLYFINSLVVMFITLYYVISKLGKGLLNRQLINKEFIFSNLKLGFYFSIGLSSSSIYNDIDKAMLAKYSTLEATGIYTAAYRLLDLTLIPIRSLLTTTYVKFFKLGEYGKKGTISLLRKLIPIIFVYSLLSILLILVFSDYIVILLGSGFNDTSAALIYLSPLILLRGLHLTIADALTGAGYQGIRSLVQIGIAIINIGLNLFTIILWGWKGAVLSSVISDGLLLILLVLLLKSKN